MMCCGPKTALRNLELMRGRAVDAKLAQIIELFRQLTPEERVRVMQTVQTHLQIEARK